MHPYVLCMTLYIFLTFTRFIEHELVVEKEAGTIEWKARVSIQQKEAQEQETIAGSKQSASAVEQVPTERGKDIRFLEMGSEEASEAETKTGKHEYTHQLKQVTCMMAVRT